MHDRSHVHGCATALHSGTLEGRLGICSSVPCLWIPCFICFSYRVAALQIASIIIRSLWREAASHRRERWTLRNGESVTLRSSSSNMNLIASTRWCRGWTVVSTAADLVRVSNILDHVQSDHHVHLMLLKKQHAKSARLTPSTYVPIAQAFTVERGEGKAASQFRHFSFCEFESHHRVDLGTLYINENAGQEIHCDTVWREWRTKI